MKLHASMVTVFLAMASIGFAATQGGIEGKAADGNLSKKAASKQSVVDMTAKKNLKRFSSLEIDPVPAPTDPVPAPTDPTDPGTVNKCVPSRVCYIPGDPLPYICSADGECRRN